MLDILQIRGDFPALWSTMLGKPLVYLDNAATMLMPRQVIEAISNFYTMGRAAIVHHPSIPATQTYEASRTKVQQFINARDRREIIVVHGATEGINLVAETFGRKFIRTGDEIVISAMEHKTNIIPWRLLCAQTGAILRVVPINDDGELIIEEYERMLSDRTKLVAIVHVSNIFGTVNPVKEIVELAHARGIPVLLDGAQAVPHLPVDVQDLDCDFYVLSAHKLYGPTGVGILYGKLEILEKLLPYQEGSDMIASATFEKTVNDEIPYHFEAGTPHIAGLIGLGAAIDYLNGIGMEVIAAHEQELLDYATDKLLAIPGLRVIGTARHKAGVIAFVLDGLHPHDIGAILENAGVAIQTSRDCAIPVLQHFGVRAIARVSLALYNTKAELEILTDGIVKASKLVGIFDLP